MKRTLKKAIKFCLYFSLLTPLITIKATYFPFVFSKAVFFQVVVQIAFVFYLVLIFKEPKYGPQSDLMTIGLLVYFGILVVTTLSAVCPERAFWSTQERMTGVFNLLHLGGFFVLLKGVFKTRKEWLNFFRFFMLVAGVTALITFFRLDAKLPSPLGNPGFLANYLIFALFFALWLFFEDKNFCLRVAYAGLIGLSIFIMYKTGRRAPLGGVFGGLIIFLFLQTLFLKSKKKWLTVILALLLIGVLLLMMRGVILKDLWQRFLKSSKPREISWGISWQAFKEKPFLGWGPENYLYAFSRHFIPEYAKHTSRWFDKAHNQYFEALVTTGVFGLLSYLFLFAFTLWNLYQKRDWALLALIPAHMFNNFFWFDTTVSLIPLFMVFAFSSFSLQKQKSRKEQTEKRFKFLLLVLVPVLGAAFYWGNLRPFLASQALAQDNVPKAISFETFVNYEARAHLADMAFSSDEPEVVIFAKNEMEKEIEKRPHNPKLYIYLTRLYYRLGEFEKAERAAERALETAPNRPDLKELLLRVEEAGAE